jgi:branched-chain amino acid transport system permease protein
LSALGAEASPAGASALRRGLVVFVLMLMAAVSGCGADPAQVRQCEQVARLLEDLPGDTSASMEVTHTARHPHVDHAVVVDYRVTDADGTSTSHWIACRFSDASPATGSRALVGVTTDREGALSPVRMAMLRIWLRLAEGGGARVPAERSPALGPPAGTPAYFVQQLVNAIPLGSAYALIAIGFSLVWGIIVRFSFSGGTLASLAVCTAFLGLSLLVVIAVSPMMVAIAAVLLALAVARGLYTWLTHRGIFQHRSGAGGRGMGIATQTALIATLALAIIVREATRLADGSRERWLEPVATASRAFFESEGFTATINSAQLMVLAIAAAVIGGLGLIMTESRFGQRYRACRDDAGMTALAGANVDRVLSRAFLLGAASTGVAAAIITLYYGTVSASVGTLIGLKALTAAVIGGLGSIGGAVAGGVAIAVFETLGAAYLPGEYRDLAIFGLLVAFLLLRLRRLSKRAPLL